MIGYPGRGYDEQWSLITSEAKSIAAPDLNITHKLKKIKVLHAKTIAYLPPQ